MGYLMNEKQEAAAEPAEWYAVDKIAANGDSKQPMKVTRLFVGDRATAAKMAAEYAAGTNLVDYEGNRAEPGEVGEAPFYRMTLVSDAMARDWRKGCEIDGCTGRMLTMAEAAEKYGMSKQSVWNRIQRGRMTAEIVGGSWRVLDATLALWEPKA